MSLNSFCLYIWFHSRSRKLFTQWYSKTTHLSLSHLVHRCRTYQNSCYNKNLCLWLAYLPSVQFFSHTISLSNIAPTSSLAATAIVHDSFPSRSHCHPTLARPFSQPHTCRLEYDHTVMYRIFLLRTFCFLLPRDRFLPTSLYLLHPKPTPSSVSRPRRDGKTSSV